MNCYISCKRGNMSFLKEMLISIPIIIVIAVLVQHMVVVPTDSMVPTISGGDIVLVESTHLMGLIKEFNPEEIKVGDIIIYEESPSTESSTSSHTAQQENVNETAAESKEQIIHRVVEINNSKGKLYFTVKGDNNDMPDPLKVYPEQVVGKAMTWNNYTLIIPQVGKIFS
jgi:signal peptidase